MKGLSIFHKALRNPAASSRFQARAFSDTVAGFQNKGGVGQGMFTENNAKSNKLVDFIANTPIKQPKISPKLKREVKK